MVDNRVHQLVLLAIKGMPVQEFGERVHRGLMVELDDAADRQTEGDIAECLLILFFGTDFMNHDLFQIREVFAGERFVVVELANGLIIAVLVDIAVEFLL